MTTSMKCLFVGHSYPATETSADPERPECARCGKTLTPSGLGGWSGAGWYGGDGGGHSFGGDGGGCGDGGGGGGCG